MHPNTILKRAAASVGITLFATSRLPRGIDIEADLRRLRLVRDGSTVFDIGANVGQTAERFVRLFPQARLLCCEPVQESFRQLEARTAPWPAVRCFRTAFGATPGTATIHHRTNPLWNSIAEGNNQPGVSVGTSEKIPIATLDGFCAEQGLEHVALLKTDTEGFDAEVLRGAERMLAEHRIDAIYSEASFLRNDRTHTSFFEIEPLLTAAGFAYYASYEPSHWLAEATRTSHWNTLFVRTAVLESLEAEWLRKKQRG